MILLLNGFIGIMHSVLCIEKKNQCGHTFKTCYFQQCNVVQFVGKGKATKCIILDVAGSGH